MDPAPKSEWWCTRTAAFATDGFPSFDITCVEISPFDGLLAQLAAAADAGRVSGLPGAALEARKRSGSCCVRAWESALAVAAPAPKAAPSASAVVALGEKRRSDMVCKR